MYVNSFSALRVIALPADNATSLPFVCYGLMVYWCHGLPDTKRMSPTESVEPPEPYVVVCEIQDVIDTPELNSEEIAVVSDDSSISVFSLGRSGSE